MRVVTINYKICGDETKLKWNEDFLMQDSLMQLDILNDAIGELERMREEVMEHFDAEFNSMHETIKSLLGL